MKWNEAAWQEAFPEYEKIIRMPFITGLINGTLDTQKSGFTLRRTPATWSISNVRWL